MTGHAYPDDQERGHAVANTAQLIHYLEGFKGGQCACTCTPQGSGNVGPERATRVQCDVGPLTTRSPMTSAMPDRGIAVYWCSASELPLCLV